MTECVPLVNRWASEQWRVATVERDDKVPGPPVKLSDDATGTRWCYWHARSLAYTEPELRV